MARIFVSYRRSDAAGYAGRLFDRLRTRFGSKFVFQDVDDIADGDAFPELIQSALTTCNIVLVVIGPNWVNTLDESGQRRLNNPKDWVRNETALALKRKVRVIPVLVGGARMPRAEDLPEELKSLADLSARTIDDTDWEADVNRLLDSVERAANPMGPALRRLVKVAAILAVLALIGVGGFYVLSTDVPDVTGRTVEESRQLAADAGLSIVREDRQVSSQPRGTVIGQTPGAGRRLGNANLRLIVSERDAVDLSGWIEIRNQGQEGTGPAFAMATAMSASLASQGRKILLAPRYLYEKARALDADLDKSEEGARVDYICAVARDYGAAPEELWPYRPFDKRRVTPSVWAELDHAAAGYKASLVAVRSLDEVHEQLKRGRPVVAVVSGSETWGNSDIAATGQISAVENPDPSFAHVVVVVSMDSMKDVIRFANSWGDDWGAEGFGAMSEQVARKTLHMNEMWAVEVPPQ